MRLEQDPFARFAAKLAILWAGIALGVAFLATPAKFLAPSLTLPVALDVGRQTFAVCNRVELVIGALLIALAPFTTRRGPWTLAFLPPIALVVLQAVWLIPTLDARVGQILQGHAPPPSSLHLVYIAVEAFKTAWLALVGFLGWPWAPTATQRRRPGAQVIHLHRSGDGPGAGLALVQPGLPARRLGRPGRLFLIRRSEP
jgi:hypothetical protein